MANRESKARGRVRAIALGATINGTYKRMPIDALAAFKADLLAILDGTDE